MPWNYRIVKEENGRFVIKEVYYSKDGSICGTTTDAMKPTGETRKELISDLKAMWDAVYKPVLKEPIKFKERGWDE